VKVNLPKVEDGTRSKLNQIKARRDDKTLDKTLNYLMSLEEKNEYLELRCTLKEKDCLDLIDQKVELIARIEKLGGKGNGNKELENGD
jgi:hypothetical protein